MVNFAAIAAQELILVRETVSAAIPEVGTKPPVAVVAVMGKPGDVGSSLELHRFLSGVRELAGLFEQCVQLPFDVVLPVPHKR